MNLSTVGTNNVLGIAHDTADANTGTHENNICTVSGVACCLDFVRMSVESECGLYTD